MLMDVWATRVDGWMERHIESVRLAQRDTPLKGQTGGQRETNSKGSRATERETISSLEEEELRRQMGNDPKHKRVRG